MVLQIVGTSRRINLKNPSLCPLVVVLVGNTKSGAYGLATARHLANHNVRVKVCLLEPEEKLIQAVLKQLKAYSFTESSALHSRAEMETLSQEPIDLIIDALLDGDGWDYLSQDLFFMIEWANNSRKNILSLDIPSGIDGDSSESSLFSLFLSSVSSCELLFYYYYYYYYYYVNQAKHCRNSFGQSGQ